MGRECQLPGVALRQRLLNLGNALGRVVEEDLDEVAEKGVVARIELAQRLDGGGIENRLRLEGNFQVENGGGAGARVETKRRALRILLPGFGAGASSKMRES